MDVRAVFRLDGELSVTTGTERAVYSTYILFTEFYCQCRFGLDVWTGQDAVLSAQPLVVWERRHLFHG